MNIVTLDIEAGGLKSPFDQLLTVAFKPYHKKPYVFKRDIQADSDKEFLKQVRQEIEKYDCLITYYGIGYDIPFLNGRLLKHRLEPLKRMLHIDCYRLAKTIFHWTIHSRRLVTICEHLGIAGKTRVTPDDWETVKYYHEAKSKSAALEKIAYHNLWDVITLEQAYDQCFKKFLKSVSVS